MRAHIRWKFFENNDLGEFIRNDSNNENWPTADSYVQKVFKDWRGEIDKQQAEINRIENKNKKTKELIANIQTWFIENYNRLKKEELRTECDECFDVKPKKPAKKASKKCEKCKTTNYFRKRTLKKPYHWEELPPYFKETKWKNFNEFFKIIKAETGHDFSFAPPEHVDDDKFTDYQNYRTVEELSEILEDWHSHNKGGGISQNHYEIFVNDRSSNSLFFEWIPPEITSGDQKGRFLSLFKTNYLFNYYGEWFEVKDWIQTGYTSVEVQAERSIFYNNYYYLIKSQVSGILHHSQSKLISREEICSCPQYDISTNFYDFASTYQLKLELYKLNKELVKMGSEITQEDLRMVVPIDISYAKPEEERGALESLWEGIWNAGIGTVYFLLSDKLLDKEKTSTQTSSPSSSGFAPCFTTPLGQLLGAASPAAYPSIGNSGGGTTSREYSRIRGTKITYFEYITNQKNGLKWKCLDKDPNDLFKNKSPIGPEVTEILNSFGLLDKEMFHFLRNHISATLYWRKKQIWHGNYWLVHNNFYILESVNPSGTCLTFFGSDDTILTRVTESITAKVGGSALVNKFIDCVVDTALNDDKGQNNRQTERHIISESSYDNKGELKETKDKASIKTKDSSKGGSGSKFTTLGKPFVKPHIYAVDHTKAEYTFFQFWHRYILSGKYPLSLRIEFNQNLLNQYKKKRALKGIMTYDYYNSLNFGEFLNTPGFFKSSIISCNMAEGVDWFREKLEDGVNLWKDDYKELFRKVLPGSINIGSRGGNATGDFNILSVKKDITVSLGHDSQTGVDGMSWVWKNNGWAEDFPLRQAKTSYCIEEDTGIDLFPQLIEKGRNHIRKDVDRHSSSSCSQEYCTMGHYGSWRFSAQANWTDWVPFKRGGFYRWYMGGFSDGEGSKLEFRPDDDNCRVVLTQNGADWSLAFMGNFTVRARAGDPEGAPESTSSQTFGFTPPEIPDRPFDPNNLPDNNRNIISTPSSGEPELHVPDVDPSLDVDPLDPDISPDPDDDPTTDPDFGKDPDLPPDTDPFDPDDDND